MCLPACKFCPKRAGSQCGSCSEREEQVGESSVVERIVGIVST